MKTKILFLICILFISGIVKAQKDPLKGVMDAVGSQVGMGDLMGQLVGGIKNSAFTGGKSGKSDLISKLSGINATDYMQYASVLGSLAGSLKGTSFLPSWASQKDGVLDKLQQAGSIADVAGGMSGILGNLSPNVLKGSFKDNLGTFNSALGLLSKVK